MLRIVDNTVGCNNVREFSGATPNSAVIGSRFLIDFLHSETVHIDEAGSHNAALKIDRWQVAVGRTLTVDK